MYKTGTSGHTLLSQMIGDSGDAVTFSAILNGCDMKTLRKKTRPVWTMPYTYTDKVVLAHLK